ncbi:glutamate synthase large subunit, partial [Candidatus Pelagibacter sp.]|nr:glutamate synthase large subunit [Candidatus Pelagibacter sp.]
ESRRKIEKEVIKDAIEGFYICSLSSKSVIYKGMFLAESIADFYLDLEDERFISRFAIFHQRFSTNTAPSWDLAQPFRALAHNGEINTYKGNTNWMKVHEQEMDSPLFDNMENLKPVIQPGSSDSAALDSVFELLNISGQSAPLAKLMLIPDAWSKKSQTLSKDHQQLFNFLNSTMEPWDGPAAIAATDNEWAIVAADRNGLRPMRYTISKDKILCAGSETGMVEIDEKQILKKGRLGPGEILGVRIAKGKVFSNVEIKDYLAKEFKHFNNQIIDLEKKFPIKNEKSTFSGDELKKRQHTFGYSLEDLELILHPMAEDAKEAIGSMGDDTPLAVLSDRYRPLYHFFRQNFSQVTNPPIDSLRENKVMSLKTRFGNLGNILDFTNLTEENIYVLDSPILSNSQLEKFINFFGEKSITIDCTFDKNENLETSIERIRKESEIAVRQGLTQLVLSDKNISEKRLPIPMLLCVGAINTYLIKKKIKRLCIN